jgi:hypothetical protein
VSQCNFIFRCKLSVGLIGVAVAEEHQEPDAVRVQLVGTVAQDQKFEGQIVEGPKPVGVRSQCADADIECGHGQ